jgi:hypothetical protein
VSRAFLPLFLLLLPLSLLAAGHDLSTTPVHQLWPVMTGNGAGFAAAWIDESAGLQVSAVSHDGEPLDDSGIALAQKYAYSVAIAHSPSDALVVWTVNYSIFAARLTLSGVLLDATAITITPKALFATNVTAAWDGSRYLVVWSADDGLSGSFVGSDGSSTSSWFLRKFRTSSAPLSAGHPTRTSSA